MGKGTNNLTAVDDLFILCAINFSNILSIVLEVTSMVLTYPHSS